MTYKEYVTSLIEFYVYVELHISMWTDDLSGNFKGCW